MRISTLFLVFAACSSENAITDSSFNARTADAVAAVDDVNDDADQDQASCEEELDQCINGPGNDGSDGDCYEGYETCLDNEGDEEEDVEDENQPSCEEELDQCINGPGNDGSDGDCYETYDTCIELWGE